MTILATLDADILGSTDWNHANADLFGSPWLGLYVYQISDRLVAYLGIYSRQRLGIFIVHAGNMQVSIVFENFIISISLQKFGLVLRMIWKYSWNPICMHFFHVLLMIWLPVLHNSVNIICSHVLCTCSTPLVLRNSVNIICSHVLCTYFTPSVLRNFVNIIYFHVLHTYLLYDLLTSPLCFAYSKLICFQKTHAK